jgi:hypothetical protein
MLTFKICRRNNAVERLFVLLCVWEISGSNLAPDTCHPDCRLLFSSLLLKNVGIAA